MFYKIERNVLFCEYIICNCLCNILSLLYVQTKPNICNSLAFEHKTSVFIICDEM